MTIQVSTSRAGHVGEIRFSNPPYNYACPELLESIADAIDAMEIDPAVSCILLSSEGKSFCAGADLAGDSSLTSGDGMEAIARLYAQALRMFRRNKPVVSAVQGAAIGAGLGLALATDFRVASPAARFSANFVRLGFHPGFALTHSLPLLIGQQKAAWMMLSATRVKSDEALSWGLVDRISAPDDVLDQARAMATEIAENGPLALIAVHRTLRMGQADAAEAAMLKALRRFSNAGKQILSVVELLASKPPNAKF